MLDTFLFYLFSLTLIAFSLGVIVARSPVYGVLSLAAAMCAMSGLFCLLKATFVAVTLVLVYAGAILVLFLFVVMLLDFKKDSFDWNGWGFSPVLAVSAGAVFFFFTFSVILKTKVSGDKETLVGSIQALGRLLFSEYLLPFELTAFLILAAIVSVTVLAKKESS